MTSRNTASQNEPRQIESNQAEAGQTGTALNTVASYFINGEDVTDGLQKTNRLYLVGHLHRAQQYLEHIGSLAQATEIGVTDYKRLTVDQPHLHTVNTDYAFVVEGTFAVRIMPTGEVRELRCNGLCAIEPGLSHVCIAHPGTKVLFVKVPGGDDKQVVELDDASRQWIESYCAEVADM